MTTDQLEAVCNSLPETALRTALTELRNLREGGPADPEFGICDEVTSPTVDAARSLACHWPKFSGHKSYPVPHPSLPPSEAYSQVWDIWGARSDLDPNDPDDQYRLNRRELLDWLIDTIESYLTPARTRTVDELRAAGFVVVIFSPEEMRGMRPKDLESFLVQMGNEAISDEPEEGEPDED